MKRVLKCVRTRTYHTVVVSYIPYSCFLVHIELTHTVVANGDAYGDFVILVVANADAYGGSVSCQS